MPISALRTAVEGLVEPDPLDEGGVLHGPQQRRSSRGRAASGPRPRTTRRGSRAVTTGTDRGARRVGGGGRPSSRLRASHPSTASCDLRWTSGKVREEAPARRTPPRRHGRRSSQAERRDDWSPWRLEGDRPDGRLITPAELAPTPRELVLGSGTPETIAAWKALAESLLTDQPCVFHRNLEISSRYAWIYKQLPAYFKWAGMAASRRTMPGSRSIPSGWTPIEPATPTSPTACVADGPCAWRT